MFVRYVKFSPRSPYLSHSVQWCTRFSKHFLKPVHMLLLFFLFVKLCIFLYWWRVVDGWNDVKKWLGRPEAAHDHIILVCVLWLPITLFLHVVCLIFEGWTTKENPKITGFGISKCTKWHSNFFSANIYMLSFFHFKVILVSYYDYCGRKL